MDEKNFFMDLSKITDENIERAKKAKRDSEYTTLDLVKDLSEELD